MRLIDADALKEDIDNLCLFKKWIREEIKQHIDNAPTVNLSLILDNITEEDIEKFKIIWQRANSKGLLVINEDGREDIQNGES